MQRKVLVTGFSPFLDMKTNPSQMLAEELDQKVINDITFVGKVLPVSYDETGSVLMGYLDEVKPDLVISTGLAAARAKLSVEKIAINYKHSDVPDNKGVKGSGDKIDPTMPDGVFSLLDVEKIVELLNEKGIPSEISTTAGAYLCNYSMFVVVREAKRRGIKGGFVHLPADPLLATASKIRNLPSMSLDLMVEGIKTIALHELGVENH